MNAEPAARADVYDEVPYPGLSHFLSHPGHVGAVAQVLGLNPASPESCRVLEIGCAAGYNLLPMAETLPASEFIGIDTSAGQIAAGRAAIEALGLTNIDLQCRSLEDIGEADGKFDYIIAYGVYSWVPEDVRDRLIAVIRSNLAESGVAYLSYDTYPGWFQMRKMREMLLYHTRRIEEPLERVTAARELVAFLAAADEERGGSDGSFIEAYARSMAAREDGFLLHDELAPTNDPVYFHEFAEHLERHGLAYLAESDFPEVMAARLAPEAAEGLNRMAGTLVEREQYMDFLRDRGFRETLVTHAATAAGRDLHVDAERYRRFYVTSRATAIAPVDVSSESVARFELSKAVSLSTNHPVSKAAMVVLDDAFPLWLGFDELFERASALVREARTDARATSPAEVEADRTQLATTLLRGFAQDRGLISLSIAAPGFVTVVTPRPEASGLARYRAALGKRTVVNLAHQQIALDPLSSRLLPFLDGEHTREQLLEIVSELHGAGAQEHGLPAASRDELEADFYACLAALAGHALLKA